MSCEKIKILGTESLGVRGMCCLVTVGSRRILIDPGLALGYRRHGLLPHPCQIANGIKIRNDIIKAMATATDIIFSHFHGDHIPLLRANPYQLSFKQVPDLLPGARVRLPPAEGLSPRMHRRAVELAELFGSKIKRAGEWLENILNFSNPVPHGAAESGFGSVMMTRIDMGEQVFVHASDIQLLDRTTIEKILSWHPDIVFAAGPPLYLQALSLSMRKQAWENSVRLAADGATLIIDHHLLRSCQGLDWLDNLGRATGKKAYCAADFMNKPRLLLEAERTEFYARLPVPENWHQAYEKGEESPLAFHGPDKLETGILQPVTNTEVCTH